MRRQRDSWSARRSRVIPCLVLAFLAVAGCRGAGEYTDTLAPVWWRDNLWGPRANAERAAGRLPKIPYNEDMIAWERFAHDHLQTGDILFRAADARVVFRLFPFSKVAGKVADSAYTHTGIFVWENGRPVVYDTSMGGARRQRFGIWVLDNVGPIGIKRPAPSYQRYVPGAVAYCRRVYATQVPFDMKLRLGEDRLYCAEMTAAAYRAAGLDLAPPVRVGDLPRIGEHPLLIALVRTLSSLHLDQFMHVPGNERFGLWSSPALESVYVAEDGRRPRLEGLRRR